MGIVPCSLWLKASSKRRKSVLRVSIVSEFVTDVASTYRRGAVGGIFVCCPLSATSVQLRAGLAIWISTDVRSQIFQNVFPSRSISVKRSRNAVCSDLLPSTPSSFFRLAKNKAVWTLKGIVVAAAFEWPWKLCLVSIYIPHRACHRSKGLHFH